MSTLNALTGMKDSEIQTWLRRVGQDQAPSLAIALAGADEKVRQCVYRNLSERANAHLRADVAQYEAQHLQEAVIQKNASELERLLAR